MIASLSDSYTVRWSCTQALRLGWLELTLMPDTFRSAVSTTVSLSSQECMSGLLHPLHTRVGGWWIWKEQHALCFLQNVIWRSSEDRMWRQLTAGDENVERGVLFLTFARVRITLPGQSACTELQLIRLHFPLELFAWFSQLTKWEKIYFFSFYLMVIHPVPRCPIKIKFWAWLRLKAVGLFSHLIKV